MRIQDWAKQAGWELSSKGFMMNLLAYTLRKGGAAFSVVLPINAPLTATNVCALNEQGAAAEQRAAQLAA